MGELPTLTKYFGRDRARALLEPPPRPLVRTAGLDRSCDPSDVMWGLLNLHVGTGMPLHSVTSVNASLALSLMSDQLATTCNNGLWPTVAELQALRREEAAKSHHHQYKCLPSRSQLSTTLQIELVRTLFCEQYLVVSGYSVEFSEGCSPRLSYHYLLGVQLMPPSAPIEFIKAAVHAILPPELLKHAQFVRVAPSANLLFSENLVPSALHEPFPCMFTVLSAMMQYAFDGGVRARPPPPSRVCVFVMFVCLTLHRLSRRRRRWTRCMPAVWRC